MARLIRMVTTHSRNSTISLPLWVLVLLFLCFVSVVVIAMSRTDGSKRKEGSVSTENRTKKRKKDGKNIRKLWEESIPKRKGFTCERQIEESSLEGTKLAELIKSRGLTHFFKPVKGYVVEWVMGGKELTITPDDIAMYLEGIKGMFSKLAPRPPIKSYWT